MITPRIARHLALSLALCSVASASVISWNYDRFGTVAPLNTAGVVAAANWNNSWPSDPRTDLVDASGAATTLDISYASFNTWSILGGTPGADADGSLNRNLLNGYLNSGPASWGPPTTSSSVTLSQIPYASYDVIVYFSSDAAGREGQVGDGVTTYYFNTVGPASVSGANAVLSATSVIDGTYLTAANYAVFTGLTGAAQTFTVQMRDNDEWGGIAGLQVVGATLVPEPAAAAAWLGAGGLLCAGVRRRR